MRRACLAFAIFLFASSALADPNVPRITDAALAYRSSLEGVARDRDAVGLLTAIRQAEAAKKTAEIIRLYEQFVALNRDNFRAWLQLGLAWREAEPLGDKGLSAAYLAYRATQASPDQLEALLLMSSLLRTQLERYKTGHESALNDLQQAESSLLDLRDSIRQGEIAAGDRNDPLGNYRRFAAARDKALKAADENLKSITQVVADLDEIYREIADKAPRSGSSLDVMKGGDARSAVFTTVLAPASASELLAHPNKYSGGRYVPKVTFQTDANAISACVEFTQELKPDVQYKEFMEVSSSDGAVATFATASKGRLLCISGLEVGGDYQVKLSEGLPSQLGAKLANSIEVAVRLPDLPRQVTFSGRNFILPTSGPGEVPIYITNVESFDLQLYRVTDRMLHRQIALGHIGGRLPAKEYIDLRDHFAEPLWSAIAQVQNPKLNTPSRAFLQVRSILDKRREWLNGRNRGQSTSANDPMPASGGLGGMGNYIAGALPFEKETQALDPRTPSVYALVTHDFDETLKKKGKSTTKFDCDFDCSGYIVQWFINTDIGLTFYEGRQDFTVVARSLRSGAAKAKTRIELVSAGNRVLAAAETDDKGVVKFPINLTRGTQSNQLVALLAYQDEDFSFLTFGSERLDLSRLNVDGRKTTAEYNGFLTTDHGIYQAGETVRLLALVRDSKGTAPEDPINATVRLEARDRTMVLQAVPPQDWSLGGAVVPVQIPKTMRPGTARITLSRGKGDEPPIGETLIQVGPVRPDRARLQFVDPNSWQARKSGTGVAIDGWVKAQYLFGDPGLSNGAAANLKSEVTVRVAPTDSPVRECYEGYSFGRFDEESAAASTRHFINFTDEAGNLRVKPPSIEVNKATRPVAANVEVTLFDVAGPLASRSMAFPIADDNGWIGISKTPSIRQGTRPGTFDVGIDLVSITGDNKPGNEGSLDFVLQRERDQYIWARSDDSWQHVKSVQRDNVAQGSIATGPLRAAAGAGANCVREMRVRQVAQGLEIGRYVLTVKDRQTGRESAIRFQTGVAATSADQLEPNIFTLYANKSVYRAGEQIELTADVPFANGELLVAFADADIRAWVPGQVRNGTAKISFVVPDGWEGQGFHALATAYRSGTDGTAAAGPARAIGAAHFEVRGNQAGYKVRIEPITPFGSAGDNVIGPNDDLSFKACIADDAGACSTNAPALAYAAAFVVDEGLLSLTGHHDVKPDPEKHFYGPKSLALRIMDNYNRLLLKEGGDRPSRLLLSNYTSPRIVALAQGPVKLENGSATFNIRNVDLQQGAVSIFVVIWSKDYAAAEIKNVRVRSPIVADMDVPSFVHAGDRVILPIRLENTELHHQDFIVKVAASGPLSGIAVFAAGTQQPQQLRPNAELRVALPPQKGTQKLFVVAEAPADARGTATLNLAIEPVGWPGPFPGHRYSWPIELRAPTLTSVDTVGFPLQTQGTNLASLLQGLIAGYDASRVRITARFSSNVQSLLSVAAATQNERTPTVLHQLVWRGLFLLYAAGPANAERKQELARILGEIQSLQTPEGSFMPYRTIGDNYTDSELRSTASLLPTVRVLDLLSLANAARYEVPDQSIRAARVFVEAGLTQAGDYPRCQADKAYAWLVLMRLRTVDYDKIKSQFLDECRETVSGKAAAALAALTAKYGLSDQATRFLANFKEDSEPAKLQELSDLDLAMTLAFLTEARAPADLVKVVTDALFAKDRKSSLSKAALAWTVRAEAGNPAAGGPRLALADIRLQGAPANFLRLGQDGVIESAPVTYQQLVSRPISVALQRDLLARGFLTIEGPISATGTSKHVPAGALRRRLFTLQGEEIDPARRPPQLGERLIVIIEGDSRAVAAALDSEAQPQRTERGPLLVADLLPSSFQIVSDNAFTQPAFQGSGALSKLAPLGILRSAETNRDRWVALVIPESQRKAGSRDDDQSETEEPPANTSPGQPPANTPTPNTIEFRQGYVVQVNAAGRFAFPATAIEATTAPIHTLGAQQSSFEVTAR
jgi:uncharacterized protein YfaS (alpha-2-macroglobulin family)